MGLPARPSIHPGTGYRPLFGGYALVCAGALWLAGIALRRIGPWGALAVAQWLGLAAGCALLGLALLALRRWRAPGGTRMDGASRLLIAG
ncbi:MAG TPA: hypothetical protein VGN32_02215, partial [Ktedonobacterales bacterium]|nr:hypothetical protein [Ktedonobacterales bacterium]